ncbi:MAG: hypothetical protein ACR2KI_04070 [Candidatus Limnocylindria bacterium]
MSELFAAGPAGTFATWVAALVTIGVWSYLLGQRRIFRLAQQLLAGLATAYLVVISVRDVLVPRLVQPLAAAPLQHPELWVGLALVVPLVLAAWAPRRIVAVPVAVLVGGTAGFALGGAVAGTLMPQLGASLVSPTSPGGVAGGALGLVVTALVLLSFLHGTRRGRIMGGVTALGRCMMVAGLGGFLGFLLVSRLTLLVDRVGFLLGDWLGILR